jgi:thiol-disulfide isomerase/thioredoxin
MYNMKKIFFFLAAVCLFSACKPQTNYSINGTVKNVKDGTVVFLDCFANFSLTPVDSVVLQNGVFKFQGNVEPDMYVLRIDDVQGPFMFFITGEDDEMNVTLNVEDMRHSHITGSAINEQYAVYVNRGDSIDTAIEALVDNHTQKEEALVKDKHIKAAEKKKLLAAAEKETEAAYEALNAKQNELAKNFILANAGNIAGQIVFSFTPQALNADDLDTFVANMKDKESEMAKMIRERSASMKSVVTGNSFVDVELGGVDDKPVKLSSVAGKGTYVLVDFWASWCGPCRQENPNVVALYKKYHSKGFDVVGISVDKDRKAWLKAIADDGLVWTHLWDKEGAAGKSYAIDYIPTTFLLDKEGKIIARGLHGDTLRDKLKELFGE